MVPSAFLTSEVLKPGMKAGLGAVVPAAPSASTGTVRLNAWVAKSVYSGFCNGLLGDRVLDVSFKATAMSNSKK
jgi:hypothetical protein